MRGRKPKPTRVKAVTGNPGRRPLNDSEPEYPPGAGEPPAELSIAAKAEWVRVSLLMTAAGVVTLADRGVLAVYCSAWSRWIQAEAEVTVSGPILKTEGGQPYQNPWLAVSNRAGETVAKLASSLGLDPSSRSRLIGSPQVGPGSKVKVRTPTKLDRIGPPK